MLAFLFLYLFSIIPLLGDDSILEECQAHLTRGKGKPPKKSWGKPQDPRISIQSQNLEIKQQGEDTLLEKAGRQKHIQDRFDSYIWCSQFGSPEVRKAALRKISSFKGAKYDEDKLDQFENDQQRHAKRKIQNGTTQERQQAAEILLQSARQETIPLMDTLSYIFSHGTPSQKREARNIKRSRANK